MKDDPRFMDHGPDSVAITGPMRAVDHGWHWYLIENDEDWMNDQAPESLSLSHIDGVQIYCASNTCRNRALVHGHAALVGVVTGRQHDHDRVVGIVMPQPGRTSTRRRAGHAPVTISNQATARYRVWHGLPVEVRCNRCGSHATVDMPAFRHAANTLTDATDTHILGS